MFDGFSENKIKKSSYPNLIYDQIIESVKDGILQPGEALPSESDFVKQFGVGRTSVREALASLEYLNIITANNGKYYINSDIPSYLKKKLLYHYKRNKEQWGNVIVVRRILEIQFALLAAQRATGNNLIFMRQILENIGEKLSMDGLSLDAADLTECFVKFHGSLAVATQNSLLARIFDRFKDLMFLDPETCHIGVETFRKLYEISQRLTGRIEDHDGEGASAEMGDYLRIIESICQKEEGEGINVQTD